MLVSIDRESPRIIRVDLSGRMDAKQWRTAQEGVASLLKEGEITPLLVYAASFDGWGDGSWDDFSFQQQYDAQIGRLAIVADKRWEDRALLFTGKGLRRIEIEFFTPAEIDRARQWLTSGQVTQGVG
jgi:hypothetical protein